MTVRVEIAADQIEEADPLDPLRTMPFDDLPADLTLRAFGVEYRHLRPREGGDLYLTRYGWPQVARLLPSRWYTDGWFESHGHRLPGSTGAVYRVETRPVDGVSVDLVAKFSRMAREVPIVVGTSFPDHVGREEIEAARFNSPFEEFGLVMELRRGTFGPRGPRVLTQRPLAIYAPPEQLELWRLGRDECRFREHRSLLAQDQEHAPKAIEIDIRRVYVLLYGWIEGKDAENHFGDSEITEPELHQLTERVSAELRARGFRVLDNKPKHFILRSSLRNGGLLRKRDGSLEYGLVDFELLQRTPDHQQLFKGRQRRRYWFLQTQDPVPQPPGLPSHLRVVTIFGVTYLFGATPDGGRIWVTGTRPELFDFFLPERWRRTPRLELSSMNENYRTRTRDGIDLVYRRSRVGTQPRSDPLEPDGQRIRGHGFNSPFEEVAIAERLRQMGIPTTCPRAIFRTAHTSTEITGFPDDVRFLDHADLLTPETPPEPILSRNHDYYTIWDRFLGRTPGPGPSPEAWLDLETAREEKSLSREMYEKTLENTRARLGEVGIVGDHLDDLDLSCVVTEGAVADLRISMDALTAWELGAISDEAYRHLADRLDSRLRAVDCEKLDLRGRHLLLSMDSDGRFDAEETGEPRATLCSFELIRGLYRPLR